jgi:chromosome partitioning protein
MKTVAVLSQKGGSGKTTLALHLAVAAEIAGRPTAIIDLDPQCSAAGWKDSREADSPVVVSSPASRLQHVLEAAKKHGTALAIIDTAPHSESAALAAARASDLVLIPCRPTILDLKAISTTVDLATLAQKEPRVILNAVPARGPLGDEAYSAIQGYKVLVSPVRICQRAAFFHALTIGKTAQEYEPNGKAAGEIARLYKWTSKELSE